MKKRKEEWMKELEEAPFLSRQKEKNEGFQVPRDYFRSLQDQVIDRLREEGGLSPTASASTLHRWRRWLLGAPSAYRLATAMATLLLLLGIGWFWLQPDPSSANHQLTYEEVQQYIEENIDDFDIDLLVRYSYGEETPSGLLHDSELRDDEIDRYLDDLIDEIDLQTLEDLL